MTQIGIMREESAKDRTTLSPTHSIRSRHYQNAGSALFLFAARLLCAVLQLRIVDRIWGGGYSGLNVLSNQVLLYVTLLEAGLAQSAITLLYQPILEHDLEKVCGLIVGVRQEVRRLTLFGTILLLPVLAGYAWKIHGALPFPTVLITLWCIAATGLIQLATIHLQVYLNASENLDRVNYVIGTGFLLKTAVGMSLAIHYHQYLCLPATTAILTLGEFVALRFAFGRSLPEFRVVRLKSAIQAIRRRARFVLVHKVAGLAYYQSDFIILSITTSLIVVKDYAKYQYVSAALLSLVGMVASALTTSIARAQIVQSTRARGRLYLTSQFAISLIGSVFMLSFWFTARTVVALAFGQAPVVGGYIVGLFGLALFLNIVKAVDDVYIMARGAFEIGYWIPLMEVGTYLTIGILLSLRMGFVGILIASIVTNLLVSIVKGVVLAAPVFEMSRSRWLTARAWSMMKAVLITMPLVLVYLIAARTSPHMILWFFVANIVAVGYGLLGARLIVTKSGVAAGAG